VVDEQDLPGELAVVCYYGEFLLFVSSAALRCTAARVLAHDAAHMLQNAVTCVPHCREFTARIEAWMVSARRAESELAQRYR
jgi:hypothetical protein